MRGIIWVGILAVLAPGGSAVEQTRKPEVVGELKGHRGGIASIVFTAKGDRIATGSGNGTVKLWDAKTGEQLLRLDDLKHNSARIANLTISHDGRLICTGSRTTVNVWDISDLKRIASRYEDPSSDDPGKLGAISGDGRICYYTGMNVGTLELRTYAFATRTTGNIDLPAALKPAAIATISDPESALAALYCVTGEKKDAAAIALVGLGETHYLTKDVPAPLAGKPISIGFSTDARWFLVGNGSKVAYWRVPGSQLLAGDPRILPGDDHFVAAAGPGNRAAVASVPAAGKKATVALFDLAGAEPKEVARFTTGIDRISALAFSPKGNLLAVADDVEGVVQLWAVRE